MMKIPMPGPDENMMKIPILSPDEKRRSIETILQNAPKEPESFLKTMSEMIRLLGLRGLFGGVGDAAFIALMSIMISGAVFIGAAMPNGPLTGRLYGAVFFFSPLAYVLLYALTAWKEYNIGAEHHNTCYFTLRHLTAVRMFCFGGAGTLVCGLLSWAIAMRSGAAFIQLLSISLCALFLFASAFLFILMRWRGVVSQVVCFGLWCLFGMLFCKGTSEYWNRALESLPSFIFFIAAALFLALFLIEIRVYFMKKGENSYAFG